MMASFHTLGIDDIGAALGDSTPFCYCIWDQTTDELNYFTTTSFKGKYHSVGGGTPDLSVFKNMDKELLK